MSRFCVPQAGDKFLWVRFGALGDVLQALAEAYLVKKKFPEIKLCFMTRKEYADVVKSQPYIEDVVLGEKSPSGVLKQTAKMLRQNNFSWIASTFKGAHMPILAWLGRIPNRLGDSHYLPFLQTGNIYAWGKANAINFHERSSKTCFATETTTQFAKQMLAPLKARRRIFCVIGASTPEKMWLTKYWIEFLQPLAAEGWGIVLNGYGEREQNIADEIAASLPNENVLNLVGKLNYMNMIAVASECQIAVGNDTGPLHMAALCGVPTVGIFDYIQPIEVGYNMPWLTFAVAREEKLQTFYAKKRQQSVLAEIKPCAVREKFDELVKRCRIL